MLLAPGGPPQNIRTYDEDSQSIRVEWEPPLEKDQNGEIIYYKLMYVEMSKMDSEAAEEKIEDPDKRDLIISNLKKWTEYRIWMLAGTMVGDGVRSHPIEVRTEEDGEFIISFFLIFYYIC